MSIKTYEVIDKIKQHYQCSDSCFNTDKLDTEDIVYVKPSEVGFFSVLDYLILDLVTAFDRFVPTFLEEFVHGAFEALVIFHEDMTNPERILADNRKIQHVCNYFTVNQLGYGIKFASKKMPCFLNFLNTFPETFILARREILINYIKKFSETRITEKGILRFMNEFNEAELFGVGYRI